MYQSLQNSGVLMSCGQVCFVVTLFESALRFLITTGLTTVLRGESELESGGGDGGDGTPRSSGSVRGRNCGGCLSRAVVWRVQRRVVVGGVRVVRVAVEMLP
jgi:hypothetical protein